MTYLVLNDYVTDVCVYTCAFRCQEYDSVLISKYYVNKVLCLKQKEPRPPPPIVHGYVTVNISDDFNSFNIQLQQ